MVGAAVNSGPRFAPHDPTLPAPWRALVDTSTGYIYYWNTETNVTQYEKPLPPQVPPLPAGPPPGAPVSATPKQSVQAAQMPSVNVSGGQDAQGGRPMEQHNVVNGSAPTSQVVSTHGGANSSYQISNPSMPGSSNVHSNTAGNLPENMYANSNSNPSGHSGMHIQNSSQRLSSGMSGGPHMSSSDPYGGSGRHIHSSVGAVRGAPASSVHGPAARSSHAAPAGNMQPQPKLATLPVSQRQQGMGGVHMAVQSRQMGHANTSGHVPSSSHGTGTTPSYKRNVGDYGNNDQDPHKRPRVQGFSEPPPTLDVHSYLRQHEITVVGDNVPPPYMTFDAANFPPEIAREVRYLLRTGAYVVRCAGTQQNCSTLLSFCGGCI